LSLFPASRLEAMGFRLPSCCKIVALHRESEIMFESCVSLVGSSLLMVSDVSAKVRRLVVSASNKHVVSRSCQPRVASVHPRLPSILESVARRCFEDTNIVAKSRYEAVVSREKREERAGCSIHCGHGLRSAGGLDSLADKTRVWSLSHASPQNTDEKEVLLAQLTDLSRRYARGPFNNTRSSSGLISTTHVS
jgi:hypothetical protein